MKYPIGYEVACAMKYAAAYGEIYFTSYFATAKYFITRECYFILRSNTSLSML